MASSSGKTTARSAEVSPDEEAKRDQGKISQQQEKEAEHEAVVPHQVKVEGVSGCQHKERR